MKHIFIINPAAGKNENINKFITDIQKAARKLKQEFLIHISESGDDITKFVKSFNEADEELRFYAVGGDGTLNKIVNGCILNKKASVGVIPNGTGNDFIKNFKTDKKTFLNIEKQMQASTTSIDLLKYNNEYCINMINIGFDANVGSDMPKFKKLPLVSHKGAYSLSVFYNVAKKMGSQLEVFIDDKLIYKGKLLMASAGNGISAGGGFYLTPYANISDGLMDIALVLVPSRLRLVPFIKNITNGNQFEMENTKNSMKYFTAKKLHIKAITKTAFVNDGEIDNFNEITIEIIPSAIKFINP